MVFSGLCQSLQGRPGVHFVSSRFRGLVFRDPGILLFGVSPSL